MRLGYVLTALWFCLAPGCASALSPAECKEIFERYGVQGVGCVDVADTAIDGAKTPMSPEKRASNLTQQQLQDHVFFPNGGARLDADAVAQVRRLANVLNTALLKETCLLIVGHSDTSGSDEVNLEVGLERAVAVSREVDDFIAPDRIDRVISQGEWQPLPNLTGASKWQRRVEIRVRRCRT